MDSKTLSLYLGCEMQYTGTGRPFRGTKKREVLTVENLELMAFSNQRKLLLRPLSSMTEEEGMEIFGSEWDSDSPNARDVIKNIQPDEELRLTPTETKTLLSKHFDLFGLIEKGEAIDSTKL